MLVFALRSVLLLLVFVLAPPQHVKPQNHKHASNHASSVEIFTKDDIGEDGHHDGEEGVEHGHKHGAFLLVAPQLNDHSQAIAGDCLKQQVCISVCSCSFSQHSRIYNFCEGLYTYRVHDAPEVEAEANEPIFDVALHERRENRRLQASNHGYIHAVSDRPTAWLGTSL